MKDVLIPALITLGAWVVLFLFFRVLSRYVLLVKKLLLQISVLIIIVGLLFFSHYSPRAPSSEWMGVLTTALLIVLIWVVLKSAGFIFFGYVLKDTEEVLIPALIRKLIMGVVYVVALVLTLKIFYPRLSLTGFLVGSTVFSAIIGLALQDILINFLSGVVLSIEKPFRLGDWIQVGGKDGVVTEISWRSTKVRTRENNLIIIPNSIIAKESVVNYALPSPLHRQTVRVGVAYDTPPHRVRRALLQAVRPVKGVLDNPAPNVYVVSYDDFSIGYELRYWLAEYEPAAEAASQVRTEIYHALKKEGIRIPYPIRDIYLFRGARAEVPRRGPHLVMLDGPQAGAAFSLEAQEVTLGREAGNTLQISDLTVSKKHARVVRREEGFFLEDLQSKTGTLVNGRKIDLHRLQEGDEIQIGSTHLLFEEK